MKTVVACWMQQGDIDGVFTWFAFCTVCGVIAVDNHKASQNLVSIARIHSKKKHTSDGVV